MKPTSYIIQLSGSPVTDFGKKDFSAHGPEQKVFTAVFGSSGSIFMDGFACYFANTDGESAHFAPEAYRTIGATKSAEIIAKASRVLSPDPIPEDEAARGTLVDTLSEGGDAS